MEYSKSRTLKGGHMQLISSVIFGISASLDALILGMCHGLKGIRINLQTNIAISLITLLGTCLSVGFGEKLLEIIPEHAAMMLGSATLISYGLFYIMKFMIKAIKKYNNYKESVNNITYDTDIIADNTVLHNYYGAILLSGVSLSLNNIGIGLGASIAGLKLIPAGISTFLFSCAFLYIGNHLGRSCMSRILGIFAEPLSGVLLIALGVWELIF
jgi:putative sporulation protein YtaF